MTWAQALLDPTWLAGALAVAAVWSAYVVWSQAYWSRRGLPHTQPRFLIGDFFDELVMRRPLGSVVSDVYRQFDGKPYVGMYKFLTPILLVRDADLFREVLIQNFTSFQSNATTFPAGKDEVFSDNPFFVGPDRWKHLRMQSSPLFTPGRVRLMLSDMAESARRLADFVEAGSPDASHDGVVLAKRFTAHASLRVLFGIESHSLEVGSEPGPFYEMGNKILIGELMNIVRFLALFNWPILLNVLGYQLVSDNTFGFFRKLLRDSVEYRSTENILRDDFVQHVSKDIMASGKVDEAALRKSTGQAVNTYIDTFETSAVVINVVLLLLAANPSKQDKLREALRAKAPEGQPLQDDAVTSAPYLEQVIKESLRLFPPLDTHRRQCTKATTLRDPSGRARPVTLRPGDIVYLPVDAVHRDPAFYSHPDEFRPEHFDEAEVEKRHKCAFQGFGDGPRQCPGMRYGMQQVKVAVATLVLRFQITLGPEQVLPLQRDPTAGVLNFKGGSWLRFRPLI